MNITKSMGDNQTSNLIRNLHNFVNNSVKHSLRNVLYKFAQNASNLKIRNNIMKVMLKTTLGKVVKIFKNWNVLPPKKDYVRVRNAGKFQERLERLYYLRLNQSFTPMKKTYTGSKQLRMRLILALSYKNLTKNQQNLYKVLYKLE